MAVANYLGESCPRRLLVRRQMKMVKKFKEIILTEDTEFDDSIEVKNNIVCEGERWNLVVEGDISARNINAKNIKAKNICVSGNVNAENIKVLGIHANNINARDIDASDRIFTVEDINARNLYARHLSAMDINANDIYAGEIWAYNISAKSIYAENILTAGDVNVEDTIYASNKVDVGNIYAEDIYAEEIICERRVKRSKTAKTIARIFIQGRSMLKRKEQMADDEGHMSFVHLTSGHKAGDRMLEILDKLHILEERIRRLEKSAMKG